jgi:hypothetical protein
MSDLGSGADGLPNHHTQIRRSRLLFRCWHRGTLPVAALNPQQA